MDPPTEGRRGRVRDDEAKQVAKREKRRQRDEAFSKVRRVAVAVVCVCVCARARADITVVIQAVKEVHGRHVHAEARAEAWRVPLQRLQVALQHGAAVWRHGTLDAVDARHPASTFVVRVLQVVAHREVLNLLQLPARLSLYLLCVSDGTDLSSWHGNDVAALRAYLVENLIDALV